MGEKLIIGPLNGGLRQDRTAFNIDNDSFPMLINAYQWRGRVKRKRGTRFLTHFQRYFDSTKTSYNPGSSTITLDGSGQGNILTGFTTLETYASVVLSSVTIVGSLLTYTDDGNGNLVNSSVIYGSINYASGLIVILSEAGNNITATFSYYPNLPALGARTFNESSNSFPGSIGFDTTYSYRIPTTQPVISFDITFFLNSDAYSSKSSNTPFTWHGGDYRQFWTTNYQGAMWTTNGIDIPFVGNTVGMQFAGPNSSKSQNKVISATQLSATQLNVVVSSDTPLIVGDYVMANEWTSGVPANASTLNFRTGYVSVVQANVPMAGQNTLTITFPNATLAAGNYTPGILQYLTNSCTYTTSPTARDCIKWFNGNPTNQSSTPSFIKNFGWVNFCPPLFSQANSTFQLADLPIGQYYLVGARIILPYKDRLLFFGPVVQTSSGDPIYLQDTIIYSQNGTPYYTASFSGSVTSTATNWTQMLVPVNQTATANAFFIDVPGFGGFQQIGLDQKINTASTNEDMIILGMDAAEVRMTYTGNDLQPYSFYLINSELGTSSTFSAINMDKNVLTRGTRGYVATNQIESQRFDLDTPDSVFDLRTQNNGTERFTSARDFQNEWCYFSYPLSTIEQKFPTATLQYNYRDQTWGGVFLETYTCYGQYQPNSSMTWASMTLRWSEYTDPWSSGQGTAGQPVVIGGNTQGFILERGVGTEEGNSLIITGLSNNVITSPNHCLNENDYIYITGAQGTCATALNNNVFSVISTTQNTFILSPGIPSGLTYTGNGLIKRLYKPFIQTKQFPTAWGYGRKTRIGVQQYLLTYTSSSQVTLYIYISQDNVNPYNIGPIIPPVSPNNALIYSTILYTCPESTNLGLTPPNINLQTPTASTQQQIWHRINTSLIGDTVQLAITLSDEQMRANPLTNQVSEIELHSIIMDVSPSQLLV